METSLHRQLKQIYAGEQAQLEVRLGRYRIDAIVAGELIEIQHGSLGAISRKLQVLLTEHRVRVVKPLIALKMLCKRRRRGGKKVERRRSPRQACMLDVFDELIYFTRVFPHPNLTMEFPLVEVEEWRYPGHGRRRWRRAGDFVVEDLRLVTIRETRLFSTLADLRALVDCALPAPFHTKHLAEGMQIARERAQRIAYCLRHVGAIDQVGKSGNSRLYQWCGKLGTTAA